MVIFKNKESSNIAKEALTEFFVPLLRVISVFKYASTAKSRDEELSSSLKSIKYTIERNNEIHITYTRLFEKINNKISKQDDTLKSISNEIINTRNMLSNYDSTPIEYDDKHSISSRIHKLVNRSWDLKTRELTHGGALTHAAAEIGLGNIEFLLKKITENENSTPHLFGINKGGSFLATYLAHRINLHEKYLVKCDYRVEFDKIMCEDRDISGPVVIIDDVTRTGKTIINVKKYLKNKYPNSNVFSFVLVTASQEIKDDVNVEAEVDYSPWVTKHASVTLPWSAGASEIIDSEIYFNDLEMDQIVARLSFDNNT